MMHSSNEDITNVEINTLLNKTTLENTGGIFKLPKAQVIDHNKKGVYPLYFEFNIDKNTLNELKKYGVIGYFFVRTKRIPTSLFQGLSMGVDSSSGISMPYVSIGIKNQYVAESFLTALDGTEDNSDKTRVTSRILEDNINSHIREFTNEVEYSSILSLDPIINYQLRNILS
jgi:hypothetical protein